MSQSVEGRLEPIGQWHVLAVVSEAQRDFAIDGVRVWDHQWEHLEGSPSVTPHGETESLRLFRIRTEDRSIIFAADEVSNQVYKFAVPALSP
jgi:hypothetical protein